MSRIASRSFDPVVVGNRETDAWAAYYRHEWAQFLVAAVAMVWNGFGMGPVRTVLGAGYVLRANQLWAPIPDNDPDAARASMRRFWPSSTVKPTTLAVSKPPLVTVTEYFPGFKYGKT